MFHDATRSVIIDFASSGFSNALECLATKHKQEGLASRNAIREMLKIKPGPHCVIDHEGTKYVFDLISVAGKLRGQDSAWCASKGRYIFACGPVGVCIAHQAAEFDCPRTPMAT